MPLIDNMQPEDLYRIQVRELADYAMFMIDTHGTLLSWNAGVERLFGYTEEEWIGKNGAIIFTPSENAEEVFGSEMQKARETGTSTDIRWHLRKDKSEFFANGFMNLVTDENGEALGYAKIVSDETARKRLQDSLTESNAALEQFAWVASHDLQEPLRTMGAFSQLLARNYAGRLDDEADRILSFIVKAASRMKSLVEDLLAYARITTEVERPASVALDEDLETAITHLSQAVLASGARVTHDALPTVHADRGQMVRLFQNLVGNALKYRKPDEPPTVHIAAQRNGPEWLFSVRDNGIGFDPRYASLIFAPFKRLHSSAEYPGTGVGLAICSRIVTTHGGRIWAESAPGDGSTFFFTLPVDGGTPPPRALRIDLPPGLDESPHGPDPRT
ncbi:MAG: ATP-binding protein [Acidobacteriota bacterium]